MPNKIITLHGWATDSSVWNSYLETFSKDYDIYNPNLPGHNRGNATPWGSSTLTPGVDLISKIVTDIGIDGPPIGIGWSLGALTLMKTEIVRPGSFRALILVGATPSFVSNGAFEFGHSKAIVKRMILDLKTDPLSTLELFYRLNFTDLELESSEAKEFLKRYRDLRGGLDLISLANSLHTLYKVNIADELGKLKIPVQIIHGSRDSVTPIAAANYLDENIRDSRLFVIDNAGHAPFITEPDFFNRITHDFISEIFSF